MILTPFMLLFGRYTGSLGDSGVAGRNLAFLNPLMVGRTGKTLQKILDFQEDR